MTSPVLRLTRQSSRQTLTLPPNSAIGRGGEAQIVPWPSDSSLVAKLYFKPNDKHAHKIAAMVSNPPADPMSGGEPAIAWPVDLLHHATSGQFAGFLMPRVVQRQPIINFYNPLKRRSHCPLFNYRYLHRTARNLAAIARAVHQRDYVIGDVNESNILVSETALVTLVDTDSFQVVAQVATPRAGVSQLGVSQSGASQRVVYRCPVGKPEYTPPELQGKNFGTLDRTVEHDLFGLAVLFFQLLMEGTHPFAGGYNGPGEPPLIGQRIVRGFFPYGKRPAQSPPRLALSYEILSPPLQALFIRCFEDGRTNAALRPTAAQWHAALEEAEKHI